MADQISLTPALLGEHLFSPLIYMYFWNRRYQEAEVFDTASSHWATRARPGEQRQAARSLYETFCRQICIWKSTKLLPGTDGIVF